MPSRKPQSPKITELAAIAAQAKEKFVPDRIPTKVGVHKDPISDKVSFLHEGISRDKFDYSSPNLGWAGIPYSLEFANFINGWALGMYRENTPNGFTYRNWSIALRKSKNMYNHAILNMNNEFTIIGKEIASDIQKLYRAAMDYRREIGEPIIPYADITFENVHEHITSINRIILIGELTPHDIRMLRILYIMHMEDVRTQNAASITEVENALNDPTLEQTPEQREETRQFRHKSLKSAQSADLFLSSSINPGTSRFAENFDTYEYPTKDHPARIADPNEYRTYMDTSAFRNRPSVRRALDRLIMYGLIDVEGLSRKELGIGIGGRQVSGAVISPIGKCFYELYLEKFDEKYQRLTTNKDVPTAFVPARPSALITAPPPPNTTIDPIEPEFPNTPTADEISESLSTYDIPSNYAEPTVYEESAYQPFEEDYEDASTLKVDRLNNRVYNINPNDFKIGLLGPAPQDVQSAQTTEPTKAAKPFITPKTNKTPKKDEYGIFPDDLYEEDDTGQKIKVSRMPSLDKVKAWKEQNAKDKLLEQTSQNIDSRQTLQTEEITHGHESTTSEDLTLSQDDTNDTDDDLEQPSRTAPPSNKEWVDPPLPVQSDVLAAQTAAEPTQPQPEPERTSFPHRAVDASKVSAPAQSPDPYPFDLDDLPTKAEPQDR